MGRTKAASTEPVMTDQTDCIAVMDQGIVAGNFLIDRDQHLLFANQLQEVPQLQTLALNHLSDRHRGRHLTGEIAFPIGRLELSHEGNRHHLRLMLSINAVDSLAQAQG